MCARYIDQLPLACPQLGTWPTTQVRALTGSRIGDLLVCRLALNPLRHTSQGLILIFIYYKCYPKLTITKYEKDSKFIPNLTPQVQTIILHENVRSLLYNFIFLKTSFIFREREREEERETWMCERNVNWLPLPCPQMGTWLAPQACAPTGNRPSDLLVRRPALNPLSHTSHGRSVLCILKTQEINMAYHLELYMLLITSKQCSK